MTLLRTGSALLSLLAAVTMAGCGHPSGGSSSGTGTASASAERSDVRFTEVSQALGIDFRWKTAPKNPMNILDISSAGAGFLDYDADGWQDVILVGPERCALFHNNHGRFEDASQATGIAALNGRWHGCASADVDN